MSEKVRHHKNVLARISGSTMPVTINHVLATIIARMDEISVMVTLNAPNKQQSEYCGYPKRTYHFNSTFVSPR